MTQDSRKVLNSPLKLLEDLVKAGSNIRVFNKTPGIGFPENKDRIIRAVVVVHSDQFGEHSFVEIVPKYSEHHINYFNCPSNRASEDYPTIESFGADKDRAVVSLSSGVTYNIYYGTDNLPEELRTASDKDGRDYNVGDLFGINY